MSKIDMKTMVKVKYSNTICWKRKTGRHWIRYVDIEKDGRCTCCFCGTFLPKIEVDRAIEEKGKWSRSISAIMNEITTS